MIGLTNALVSGTTLLFLLKVFLMVMEDDIEALWMNLNFLEKVNKS